MSEPDSIGRAGSPLHAPDAKHGAPRGTHPNHASPGRDAWQRFRSNRPAVASAWFLVLLLLAVFAWPVILKISSVPFAQLHNPNQLSDAQFSAPSLPHWFGTDLHGRDRKSTRLNSS